ncbi:MAG: hypothetical protein M3Q33_06275 [Acidobacteriota bacterium]|nr:hypothetical protein [Acidobacteriota bacterium]
MAERRPLKPIATTYDSDGYASATPTGFREFEATDTIPAANLPSYVDDVLEYADLAGFPGTGTTGKIYVALDTNKTYRWSGSTYIEISAGGGTVDSTIIDGSANAVAGDAVFDALALKAPIASPSFAGSPTIPAGQAYKCSTFSLIEFDTAKVIINANGLTRVDMVASPMLHTWNGIFRNSLEITGINTQLTSQFGWGDVGNAAPDTGLARASAGRVKVTNGSTGSGDLQAGVLYLTDGTVKQVTFGANDSAGTGFKTLKIPN